MPQLYLEDDRLRVAFVHNVLVCNLWAELDLPRATLLCDAYRTLAERHDGGICSLSVLEPTTPIAPADARAEITRTLNELGAQLLFTGLVIEADGVLGLMLRSTTRGLNVLLRSRRVAIYSHVESALSDVVPHVVGGASQLSALAELKRTAALVRRQAGVDAALASAADRRAH